MMTQATASKQASNLHPAWDRTVFDCVKERAMCDYAIATSMCDWGDREAAHITGRLPTQQNKDVRLTMVCATSKCKPPPGD
jgi:hypothetical protein